MEILSNFNLFNKKNNLHQKKASPKPQKITLKLLEEKLLTVSLESNKKKMLTSNKNKSEVYLNQQFEETFPVKEKTEGKLKKNNKISLSAAILKFEHDDSNKKCGFLPALFEKQKKSLKKSVDQKKNEGIQKINKKNDKILVEEHNESSKFGDFNIKMLENEVKLEKKNKKSGFSNAKYFKNAKNSSENLKKFSFSFPALSNLLVSMPILNEKSMEKPIFDKNMKKTQRKINKSSTEKKNEIKEDQNKDFGEIKSLVLLNSKKNKAKFRDEEEKNDLGKNKKIIKI